MLRGGVWHKNAEPGEQVRRADPASGLSAHRARSERALDSSHKGEKNRFSPAYLDSWRENFVAPVLQSNTQSTLHAFICTGGNQTKFRPNASHTQPDWSQLTVPNSSRARVVIVPPLAGNDTEQYARMEHCYLHAKRFETARQVVPSDELRRSTGGAMRQRFQRFTHFVRARFDLSFFAPLPIASFDTERATVKARAALLADACQTFPRSAMILKPPKGKSPCDVPLTGFKMGVNKQTNKPNPRRNISTARAMQRSAGISACVAVDDMFAIVPSHLSAAYFLRPRTLAELYPQMADRGWNISRRRSSLAAVQSFYGPSSVSAQGHRSYMAACGGIPFIGGREAGQDGVTYKNDVRSAERLITTRLHSRLVPLLLAPLPFVSAVYGGGGLTPDNYRSDMLHC